MKLADENKIFGVLPPELVVYACLGFPALYIFLNLTYNKFIPIIAAGVGLYFLNEQYVLKSKVRPAREQMIGPSQPYLPPGSEQFVMETDYSTGQQMPRKIFIPPMAQQPNQPPQYSNGYYVKR